MEGYDPAEAAQRSGIGVDELDRMVGLGILTPDADNRFTPGHLRRAALVKSLAAVIRDRKVSSTSSMRPHSSGSRRSAASRSVSWPNGPACRSSC